MLRCCAGICGGRVESDSRNGNHNGAAVGRRRMVTKPILRVDEPYDWEPASPDEFFSALDLAPAPPGCEPPLAATSRDFPRNSTKLLVLVPAKGATWACWDPHLAQGRGATAPLLRWATSNGYSVAVFSAEALSAKPQEVWERVLTGSPASWVGVVAATGTVPLLREALAPLHPLLFSRYKVIAAPWADGAASAEAGLATTGDLRIHLQAAIVEMPAAWADLEPFAMHQCLFQALLEREDKWARQETNKYSGFQGLKENDMPGLKRLPMDARIKRLDRDRGNDELSRLLRKHEADANESHERQGGLSDDEPGVD